MLKKYCVIFIIFLISLGLYGNVLAADTYTATSIINGVTVNWEYNVNESNQIENLKCTNPEDLTGNITIPSTLDGKIVISLKDQALKGAVNITGVTLSDSVKRISYNVFEGCSNLTTVNLNKLEGIGGDAFKDCPKLTEITIPKTLVNGNIFQHGPFSGTTKLTKVTFEEGCTIIPEVLLEDCTELTQITLPNTVSQIGAKAFKGCTGITEITLPDSVKGISYNVFEGCSNLTTVNLNKLEGIGGDAFKDCPKLTEITIPKTLVNGNIFQHGPFSGTTKLTKVTFEEGCTIIPEVLLEDCTELTQITLPNTVSQIGAKAFKGCTGITEITLPDSVKGISYNVFEGCSNLTTVNLNKLEGIGGDAFKDCPKLTEITIPKTLVNGNIFQHGPFSGTTKLTKVTFEEGCTIIPEVLLEDCTELTQITLPNTVSQIGAKAFKGCTGITEIALPNSVKKISYNAFEGCINLLKITILDNCTMIGDDVFANHNEDLTIYCYEGSRAAEYAIENNIKYVYLTRPAEGQPTDNKNKEEKTDTNIDKKDEKNINTGDTTTAKDNIPQTGVSITIVGVIAIVLGASIFTFIMVRRYKEIK